MDAHPANEAGGILVMVTGALMVSLIRMGESSLLLEMIGFKVAETTV